MIWQETKPQYGDTVKFIFNGKQTIGVYVQYFDKRDYVNLGQRRLILQDGTSFKVLQKK